MKKAGLFVGIIVFIVLLLMPPIQGVTPVAMRVAAIAGLMLVWWITEAVPIPVAALLPMVLLPTLQVYDMKTAAEPYASPIVFLFMGGFMLALAMEKWNLHRRIALGIVRITGTRADGIILGFMLATAFLSMWISNTATTVMMLPIAISVIGLLQQATTDPAAAAGHRAFGVAMMLGIAYAASIGGTATLIGTPPNVVFAGFIQETYQAEIDFATWMAFAFPFALLLLLLTYWVLTKIVFPNRLGNFEGAKSLIADQLAGLGRISKAEQRTMLVFVTTALAWIFRSPLNDLLGLDKAQEAIVLSDEMIAIFATLALFLIPVDWRKSQFLLAWEDTQRLPWGILLLFGGGLSLADALKHVGWIDLIGEEFATVQSSGFVIILGLTAVSLFLTEVMSNVALVTVFLPVVGAIAVGMGLNPVLFCIPVTLAASCAFMLPMGTPPNAIVFASGHLRMADMVKAGLWLNLIAIALIAILARWVLPGLV